MGRFRLTITDLPLLGLFRDTRAPITPATKAPELVWPCSCGPGATAEERVFRTIAEGAGWKTKKFSSWGGLATARDWREEGRQRAEPHAYLKR